MKKRLAVVLSVMLAMSSITGCGDKTVSVGSPDTELTFTKKDDKKEDSKENTSNSIGVVNNGKIKATSFKTMAEKWEVKAGSGSTVGSYGVSTIYNVDENAKFTFHFNSKVDPFQAVTVHTDRACGVNSIVATQNQSYFTEEGGIDVIVTNWLSPVLDSKDRLDHIDMDDSWGHAGRYYLSVNYDMEASTPTKLANPIIIPFTLQSDVMVPQTTYKITQNGEFQLSWTDCDADKYRIYVGTKAHNRRPGTLEREYGYIGLHLTCVDEVDGGVTEYKLKDNTTSLSNSTYDMEYYPTQNLIEDGVYFVTAVKDGKESDFGLEVSVYNYLGQLPYTVENNYFDRFNLDLAGAKLPEQVNVVMKDNSVATYPVNYKLMGVTDYSNIDNSADYYYEVVGTNLNGFVSVNIGDNKSPDKEIISLSKLNSGLYETRLDLSAISDSSFPTVMGVDNADVDLTKIKTYNPNARVVYNQDALQKRLDLEAARVVSDGEYTSDPNSIYVVDYNDRQNDLAEREKQLGNIFEISNEVGIEDIKQETVEETSGGGSNFWDFTKEEPTEETIEETTEETTEAREAREDVNIDNGIDSEINSDNIIDKKIEEDNKNFEEGLDIELELTGKYPIFADSLEEEYLASCMVSRVDRIRIDILPTLMEPDYLLDVLGKVVYQNPYILGFSGLDIDVVNDEELYLLPMYEYTVEETKQKQEEIYNKTVQVANEIYSSSMSDEDKIEATWKWLENNAVYDYDCCDYLEAHNFQLDPNVEYPYKDSSSVYGILCKGVGVCQSYSYAMKTLLTYGNVDCISVVGYVDKTLPHAWNAVNLGGKYYQIDSTNNYTTMGLPYYMYNVSSDYAQALDYVPDDRWSLDKDYAMITNTDNSKEWYSSNNMVASDDDELVDKVVKGWKDLDYTGYSIKLGYDVLSKDPNLANVGGRFATELLSEGLVDASDANNVSALVIDDYLVVIKDIQEYQKEHQR